MPARLILWLMFLAGAVGVISAQPAASGVSEPPVAGGDASQAVPTIQVTSRLVVLDVVVSDAHGHAGTGLQASDFHLTEDGVPQTIDSFTEHDATAVAHAGDEEPLPPNTFTVQAPLKSEGAMTVIVVAASRWDDFIHSQLKAFFQTPPSTPTAIFRSDGVGMHLIQGFTLDHRLLMDAAMSKRIWMPLGPKFRSDPASFRVRAAGPRTQRLAAYLAGVPGRINLIWLGGILPPGELSRDFPDESTSLAEITNMVGRLNGATDVRQLSRIALYSVRIGGCASGEKGAGNSNGGRNFFCTFPKQAMEQVAATGSHYYTIAYRPTNGNWNGGYRHIRLQVAGFAQPPFSIRWSQLITGWADDEEPTLMYRHGYFGDPRPAGDTNPVRSAASSQDASSESPRRKLISASPKGDMGPNAAQIEAATAFGSPTPDLMHFTIVVTPAAETEQLKGREQLPADNFLTTPFRDGPYRKFRIHYRVDPRDLHLEQNAEGRYVDDLRTIAVVYRDDGVTANSVTTVTHLDVSAADAETILASGFILDQTVAVPTTENFFLRTAVAEQSSGHTGAIEVPIEWIKLEPSETASTKQ